MSKDATELEEQLGLSTYGLITTKRLLARYTIDLTDEQLGYSLKTANTFYHRLLRIPLKNILNGIILQQAKDYQLYVQKIFIDYLLGLESAKKEEGEEESSSYSKENLETLRLDLVEQNERFHETDLDHQRLIGYSQAALLKHANDWKEKVKQVAASLRGQLS